MAGERTFTATDKLRAVERELKYRHRVYERKVSEGSMTRVAADEQIAVMEAIAADYRELAAKERLL